MKRVYYIPLDGGGEVQIDLDACRRVRVGSQVANYDPRIRLKAEWVYLTPAPDERLVAEITVTFTRGNNVCSSVYWELDPAQIEQELAAVDVHQEHAETLRSALPEIGVATEGLLRLETGLTEREYRKAVKLLKAENAVQTKTGVGIWPVK